MVLSQRTGGFIRWLGCALVLLGGGYPTLAEALPGKYLSGIELNAAYPQVESRLQASGSVNGGEVDKPQQYVQALVASDMLAMLNRAHARHQLLDANAALKPRFLTVERDGYTAVHAFVADKLVAVFEKHTIGVDAAVAGRDNPFSDRRLAPLHDFLKRVQAACTLKPTDPAQPSHFVYTGTCAAAKLYLEYHPAQDQFWLLYYNRSI